MTKALIAMLAVLIPFAILQANECSWCTTRGLESSTGDESTKKTKLLWSRGEAETNKIDLLIAYDSSALAYLSQLEIDAADFTDELVLEMNSGLARTGLDKLFLFRLAGNHDFGGDLSGTSLEFATYFAAHILGSKSLKEQFATLRSKRDAVAADVVVLLTKPRKDGTAGCSMPLNANYLSNSGLAKFAEQAYCVCDIQYALTRHTVLHEVGHIMGAGHPDTQKSSAGPQLFSYSAGYAFRTSNAQYVTVMGYPSASEDVNDSIERLPFFSSPEYLLDGVPVGTTDKNDNTRTLRETYRYVANFRVKTYIPGYEPSDDDDDGGGSTVDVDDISISIKDGSGIDITDGQTIELTQFENVDFPVAAECWSGEKARVKVTGLPIGMKFSSKTGKISGYPKKPGFFAVTVTAKAKGMATNTLKFTISVDAIPNSIVGTYVGIISSAATGDVLATATMYKTGRMTVKFRHEGANRTFSCYGFSGTSDGAFSAAPARKIKNILHTLDIAFDLSGRSLSIDGYSGRLLQNPWGRKDISAPMFKKAVQFNTGDFTIRLYGKGKAKFSGAIYGRKVRGIFQLVAGTPDDGYVEGVWSLPVAFAAKNNFSGWARVFSVTLTLDVANRVTAASVE